MNKHPRVGNMTNEASQKIADKLGIPNDDDTVLLICPRVGLHRPEVLLYAVLRCGGCTQSVTVAESSHSLILENTTALICYQCLDEIGVHFEFP